MGPACLMQLPNSLQTLFSVFWLDLDNMERSLTEQLFKHQSLLLNGLFLQWSFYRYYKMFYFWCKIYNLPFTTWSQLFLLLLAFYIFYKQLVYDIFRPTIYIWPDFISYPSDITIKIFTLFFQILIIDAIPSTIVPTIRYYLNLRC